MGGHQVLRDFSCQNLETYTAKITTAIIANSKHKIEYEIGEYVIPKIDRFHWYRSTCTSISSMQNHRQAKL
jgi:hypothetical protein